MMYYSGLLALSQYVFEEEHSIGLGSDASMYLNEKEKYIRDTNNSKLGNLEVAVGTIIPTGEEAYCASHARAYCDMLVEHLFDELKDLYFIAIDNYAVLNKILLILRTNSLFNDKDIVEFLNNEFGSYFRGYLVRYGEEKALSNLMNSN